MDVPNEFPSKSSPSTASTHMCPAAMLATRCCRKYCQMRWYLRVYMLVPLLSAVQLRINITNNPSFSTINKGIRISILARQFYDIAWNKLIHRRKGLERGVGNCSEAGIDVLKETCYSVARTKQGHTCQGSSVGRAQH